MFYIQILKQPPNKGAIAKIAHSNAEAEQKSLVRHYQAEAKKIHQNIRETYHLERRLLL